MSHSQLCKDSYVKPHLHFFTLRDLFEKLFGCLVTLIRKGYSKLCTFTYFGMQYTIPQNKEYETHSEGSYIGMSYWISVNGITAYSPYSFEGLDQNLDTFLQRKHL